MATMTVAVLLLTGWLLGQRAVPAWRERLITQAIADSGGPAFWWPASWREEYKRRDPDVVLFKAGYLRFHAGFTQTEFDADNPAQDNQP